MADYEVAVVGGGPAGLAAALTLSRSMMRCVVLDSPLPPRNDASPHVGAYPAMDMASPHEVRETMVRQIGGYGFADIKSAEITGITGDRGAGFRLATRGGSSFAARRVLVTTGMVDDFPKIAGLKNRWGTSVINCPFCQGFELKGRPWAIYVHRPEMLAAAEVYRNWTGNLTMIVEPSIQVPDARAAAISDLGIELVSGTIVSLDGPGRLLAAITLHDGRLITSQVLLVWPKQIQCDLVTNLGLALGEDGYVAIDNSYRTGTAGIYAAGDLTYGGHQNTNTAIHMGNMAAAWIVFDLCYDSKKQASAESSPVPSGPPQPAEAAREETFSQSRTA